MRSLNYNGDQLHVFICSPFFFSVANLCHGASRGQAVIYTNSLPRPFVDLGGGGVITWEQNGFISFNPPQQFALLIFAPLESAQLESSKRQWGNGQHKAGEKLFCPQINQKSLCWHATFAEMLFFFFGWAVLFIPAHLIKAPNVVNSKEKLKKCLCCP